MSITTDAAIAECICRECGVSKPHIPDHFNRNRSLKYGLKRVCRGCERALFRKGGRYYKSKQERSGQRFTRKTGVPYQYVLPEAKWPVVQSFLNDLSYYARLAQQRGGRPHVGPFMAEWGGHTKRGGGLSERENY